MPEVDMPANFIFATQMSNNFLILFKIVDAFFAVKTLCLSVQLLLKGYKQWSLETI